MLMCTLARTWGQSEEAIVGAIRGGECGGNQCGALLMKEALRGTQRHSEGLRGTQREALRGSQRLSQRRSEALRGTQREAEGGKGTQRQSESLLVRAWGQQLDQRHETAFLRDRDLVHRMALGQSSQRPRGHVGQLESGRHLWGRHGAVVSTCMQGGVREVWTA